MSGTRPVEKIPGISDFYGKELHFEGEKYIYGGDAKGTGRKKLDWDETVFDINKYAVLIFAAVFIAVLITSFVTKDRNVIISTVVIGAVTTWSGYKVVTLWKKIPNNILSTVNWYNNHYSFNDLKRDIPLFIKGARLSFSATQLLLEHWKKRKITNEKMDLSTRLDDDTYSTSWRTIIENIQTENNNRKNLSCN